MIFCGSYRLDVDKKGRFKFPKVWEKDLGKKIFICKLNENMLKVSAGEKVEKSFESFFNGETLIENEEMQRILASSQFVECDGKGRFILPPSFGFTGTNNVYAVGGIESITLFYSQEFYEKMIGEQKKYMELLDSMFDD